MVMLVTENELLSAAINSEGRLTFTRENGDIIDAGVAVGPAVTDADMAANIGTGGAFDVKLDASLDGRAFYSSTVPSYAGTRTHSYDRALRLYNGESPELIDIRARIAKGRRGDTNCRLALPGDSRIRGAGIEPVSGKQAFGTYSLPAQLREMLAAREGAIYIDPLDSRIATTGFALYANPDGNYAALPASTAGEVTVTLPACTGFELWGFRTGSSISATVTVDGGAGETFTPGSGATWKRFSKTGLANTTHTVVISVAAGAGSWSLLKIAPTYPAPVLTVTNAGRSSSNPAHWDDPTWNKLLPSMIGTNLDVPDVVVMQIGTNWGASTYANLQSIVTKLRAAGSKIMLVSFGPRAEDEADPVFDVRRGYQYDLADEFDLPLLDNLQVIGDWATANGRGLFRDTVHEKPGGLALETAALARVLAG